MAFDETLAKRVRKALARKKGITEIISFGGLCFMLNGHMLVGVWKDAMIVRLSVEQQEDALLEAHVKTLDIKRKPMKGWIKVAQEGVQDVAQVKAWIQRAVKF